MNLHNANFAKNKNNVPNIAPTAKKDFVWDANSWISILTQPAN